MTSSHRLANELAMRLFNQAGNGIECYGVQFMVRGVQGNIIPNGSLTLDRFRDAIETALEKISVDVIKSALPGCRVREEVRDHGPASDYSRGFDAGLKHAHELALALNDGHPWPVTRSIRLARLVPRASHGKLQISPAKQP